LSQWEKLINDILVLDKNLRFDDLIKALIKIGFSKNQPKGGSSHFTFRKPGKMPITLPKSMPMYKVYINMVRDAIIEYENEDD